MKEKWSFRFNVLLFCVTVFTLTSTAYLWWLTQAFPFWAIFVFLAAFLLLFAFINDVLLVRFKWRAAKVFLLTLTIAVISAVLTQSVWTIVIPSWSFSVATNKSTFRLGEDVRINASLRNTGFIAHSFKSKVSDPMLISIVQLLGPGGTSRIGVWWNSPWKEDTTEFSIMPNQSLERSFIWNQTNISTPWFWNQTYMPGTYVITVFIPEAQADVISDSYALFSASAKINITSF